MVNENNKSWMVWSKHVLAELERLNNCYETIDDKLDNHLQHTEQRLTSLETSLNNQKWAFGIIISVLIVLCVTILGFVFG